MTVPFVRLTGTAFERGRQHGAARADALHAFLADDLCRLNRLLPAPTSLGALRATLSAYRKEIERATPDLAEELDGLAEGAGITHEQAVLLQSRREILGYQRVPTRGDCTTYAADEVLAQTVDLNGNLDDQLCVLDTGHALILSFHGLLGYLGVNADGLAIGLNLVLGGAWRPGLPPYLAIRHLLDTATGVDHALEILYGLRLASSRSLTFRDTNQTVQVEILGDDLRVVDTLDHVHTNHFLHPDFVARDELNVFARNSSVRRLESCRAALAEPRTGVEDHFAVLSTPPIRVADTGDLRRERTVAAVVLVPERRELHVRPGDPAAGATHSFRLIREPADA
jgi:isopenicillin-N N-acyltransferase like protein